MPPTEPMDEEEFRESIYQKYPQHFDHLYRLHQFAQETMGNYKGVATTPYETSLWLVLGRAFKSLDSILRLCEIASCEDAAVVLRSLLNLLVVTRWISLDPGKRASKYLAWYWIEMQAESEKFKDRIPPEWMSVIQEHYEDTKWQFEYKDAKGRPRLAEKWYEPEAHTIRDLFVQVDLEKQYEEGYKPLSGVEHSDATAYFAMIGAMEKGGDEKRLELHSDLFLPPYLRNAFQYFANIFRICNQTLHVANAEQLEEIVAAGINFHKADMG